MAAKQKSNRGFSVKAESHKLPTIAIVGRPNVGKSALFNRFVRRRMAIVHEQSGVTRDRVAAIAEVEGRKCVVVDTGGLGLFRDEKEGQTPWESLIREQLQVALESADRVIFVVDITEGVSALDKEVALLLRESDKSVIVAANKADNGNLDDQAADFSELGFEEIIPISCTQNRGLRMLFENITEGFPTADELPDVHPLRIAVVGRPNVGKSSLINQLLGEDRVIVSDVAGTTRDAIDIPLTIHLDGDEIAAELIDTAGLRRKGKIDTVVEYFSMGRTETAIKKADVVLIVLDANTPATAQDRKICRMVYDAGKPCVLLLNKWDLASKETKQKDLLVEVQYQLPFMNYAEAMTCCAVSGYNLADLIPKIITLRDQGDMEFSTSLVNRVAQDAMLRLPPPRGAQGRLKVYYSVCTNSKPPTFLLFVNNKQRCQANYLQYLRHQFAAAFGVRGVPVVVILKNRRKGEKLPEDGTSTEQKATKPKASKTDRPYKGRKPAAGRDGKKKSEGRGDLAPSRHKSADKGKGKGKEKDKSKAKGKGKKDRGGPTRGMPDSKRKNSPSRRKPSVKRRKK